MDQYQDSHIGTRVRTNKLLLAALVFSIFLNLFQSYRTDASQRLIVEHRVEKSSFAELTYDTPFTYSNDSDFLSRDAEISDQAWSSIDTSPLYVIMDDPTAQAHGIDLSTFPFPWDESQRVYVVKAFHDLHCLKRMRHTFDDMQKGIFHEKQRHHFYHCLDSIRQNIQCHADDSLVPFGNLPHDLAMTQTAMCRNFDALIRWTEQPENSACYSRADDKGLKKYWMSMDNYAFCREDSPYYAIQQAYAAKWGHKEGALTILAEEGPAY